MIDATIIEIAKMQSREKDHQRDLDDNKKYSKFLDDVIKLAQDQQ